MGSRQRFPKPWTASILLAFGFAGPPALAQLPGPSPLVTPMGPTGHVHRQAKRGPIHHVGFVVHDQFIGDPNLFKIPPLGYSLYRTMGAQTAKANVHTFMLYRSDFIAGTNQLTPTGARRLSYLASRLPHWHGPIVVEWTPQQPGLAEARRMAVLASLATANLPPMGGRTVIGPSPYPGLLGVDAANNYDTLIGRDLAAPRNYSLSPTSTAGFGGGAR